MSRKVPFFAKWTITEDELRLLKHSEGEYLRSQTIPISSDAEYYLQIYPNGLEASNKDAYRGQVFVTPKVDRDLVGKVFMQLYTVKIETANDYSKRCYTSFEPTYYDRICETSELFDPKKKFIVDGKLVLMVYGDFGMKGSSFGHIVPNCTLADKLWEYDDGKDCKIMVDGRKIKVHKFILELQAPTLFSMLRSTGKKASAKTKLSITGFEFEIVERALMNFYGCSILKDRSVDKIMALLKFYEHYSISVEKNNIGINFKHGGSLGHELWQNEDSKDVEIIVKMRIIHKQRPLKAHKMILAARSKVFAREVAESDRIFIPFSYKIVEHALMEMYEAYGFFNCSDDDKMSLFKFYDLYDIPELKDRYERILINEISAATVCRFTNFSIDSNVKNLKKKCMDFLMEAFASMTPLSDVDTLDKGVALEILQKSGYRNRDKRAALKTLQKSLINVVYTQKQE